MALPYVVAVLIAVAMFTVLYYAEVKPGRDKERDPPRPAESPFDDEVDD